MGNEKTDTLADTVYSMEEKPDADKITELIKSLDDNRKSNMLIFMQGVQFAINTVSHY